MLKGYCALLQVDGAKGAAAKGKDAAPTMKSFDEWEAAETKLPFWKKCVLFRPYNILACVERKASICAPAC